MICCINNILKSTNHISNLFDHRKTCDLSLYEQMKRNKSFVLSVDFVFATNKDISEAD